MSDYLQTADNVRIWRDPACWCVQWLTTRTRTKDAPDGSYRQGDSYQVWSNEKYVATLEQLAALLLKAEVLSAPDMQRLGDIIAIQERLAANIQEWCQRAWTAYEAALLKEADKHDGGNGGHVYGQRRRATANR